MMRSTRRLKREDNDAAETKVISIHGLKREDKEVIEAAESFYRKVRRLVTRRPLSINPQTYSPADLAACLEGVLSERNGILAEFHALKCRIEQLRLSFSDFEDWRVFFTETCQYTDRLLDEQQEDIDTFTAKYGSKLAEALAADVSQGASKTA